jgi:FdhD protein
MESFTITRIDGNNKKILDDALTEEISFTIVDGDKDVATVLCSPMDLEDLTRGFLFSGAVKKIISDFRVKSTYVNALAGDFQKRSQIYLKTGGVHSAALADEKEILIFREDIGRHNAIDKVIGQALFRKVKFEDKILLTSGRVPSEVLLKVEKCNIPIVVSKSAPTNQAVRLARESGMTLIGFARGSKMNIYSGEKRVI